ncbi:hypothetical protein ACGFRG_25865 [Streptomyces sp. NPDC048696]|uniref:hypothetical protein n=1 Tax=Streptomyces sp. NPDC048696 TaxID=3365585 RepID=UPI0037235766
MNAEPCVECGDVPELLDEDLICAPCRIRIHLGATTVETKLVEVRFEVEETLRVDVVAELEVPVDIVDDDEALQDWLQDQEDLWASDVDPDDAHDIEREVVDVYGTAA